MRSAPHGQDGHSDIINTSQKGRTHSERGRGGWLWIEWSRKVSLRRWHVSRVWNDEKELAMGEAEKSITGEGRASATGLRNKWPGWLRLPWGWGP